MKITNLWK